jgi:PAS domain S-box-containing protein
MLQFDIRTLSFVVMVTGFLTAGALIINWNVQKDNRSVGFWALGFSLSALAGFLIWLKDSIPDFFAVPLSNTLLVAGGILRYWGVSIFLGRPHRLWPGILVVTVSFVCFMYVTYVHFSTSIRLAVFSLIVASINFATAWLLFTRIDKDLGLTQRVTAVIFVVYGIIVTFRAVTIFLGARPASSLDPIFTNAIGYLGAIVFWIGIGFSLLSMMYKRSQVHLEHANRESVEAADAAKASEESLRTSEERLRLAQSSANVGIWDWNLRSGEVTWTKELEWMYGYAEGAFPGTYDGFSQRVHPDDLAQIQRRREEAVRESKPYDFDFRILLPSGETRWVNSKGSAHYDETGKPDSILESMWTSPTASEPRRR